MVDIFHDGAYHYEMEIHAVNVQLDHLQLSVSFPPSLAIADEGKLLKSISARRLRHLFPTLKRQARSDHLWPLSYYVGTAGSVSAETIRHYTESQDARHVK